MDRSGLEILAREIAGLYQISVVQDHLVASPPGSMSEGSKKWRQKIAGYAAAADDVGVH